MNIADNPFFKRSLPDGTAAIEYYDTETKLILLEAEKLGITYEVIDGTDAIRLSKDGKTHHIRSRYPSTTNAFAYRICQSKPSTKVFLERAGVQTPKGYFLMKGDTNETFLKAWNDLQKPIVFKPTHGTHGNAIIAGLTDWNECLALIQAYFANQRYEGGILLEEMFVGNECRIVATKDKVVAVMERVPANVIGNGVDTIQKLIEAKNEMPIRNVSQDLYPRIVIDDDLKKNLSGGGSSLDSVPEKDQRIFFRTVSNIMAGGDAIDRTDDLHPSVVEIVLRAVNSIPGLTWAGVDFMSTDLTKPQTATSYCIIELGALPEFAMHDIPMIGEPRGVAKEFLKLMFPAI